MKTNKMSNQREVTTKPGFPAASHLLNLICIDSPEDVHFSA
jgi:hypothetical protein